MFSPVPLHPGTQYTLIEAQDFCETWLGSLVQIDSEKKYDEVAKFASDYFSSVTQNFLKARFWLVELEFFSFVEVSFS